MFYLTTFAGMLLLRFAKAYNLYHILLLLLFIFTAFRFEVGCDWTGYSSQYQIQLGAGWRGALENAEPLWWLVIEITQRMGLPYPWLNVFSSIIFFTGIHIFARRQPDPLGFLVLLFPILIVNMPMSGIRQAAAIGLICVGFSAFLDRRLIAFVVWTCIASGFHSSAILFILLAPLVSGDFTRTRLVSAAVLAIPGGLLLLSGASADMAFSRYVDTQVDAFGATYRTGVLFLSGVFFFLVLRHRWTVIFPRDLKLASLGALMMLANFPLVLLSTVIADRLGYYFIPLQAMIFARVPFLLYGRRGRFWTMAPYLGLAAVFVVWTMTSQLFQQCYLPYQSWLFGFPAARYSF